MSASMVTRTARIAAAMAASLGGSRAGAQQFHSDNYLSKPARVVTVGAWIADTLASRFPAPAALERRRVRVTGVIWMQDGKWPAVTLERPEDLTIVDDAPR